ncbi:MAG: hypothetical protein A2Y81_07225 [Nitrospirae bacterium RBG_13_43_8]|nr:MAG: hypothetical protein A2Y81_07225 [Nitrospirae bacterium RBG_13_43_8]
MFVVTAPTLAPCLTLFFKEFFIYQALANSVIPKRISSNRVSMKAVSIIVCPFCLLKVSMLIKNKSPAL